MNRQRVTLYDPQETFMVLHLNYESYQVTSACKPIANYPRKNLVKLRFIPLLFFRKYLLVSSNLYRNLIFLPFPFSLTKLPKMDFYMIKVNKDKSLSITIKLKVS